MKKIIAFTLALLMLLGSSVALAVEAGEKRVTLGADLDDEQRAKIYGDFGLSKGDVDEITVTNADERRYLSGLVPDSKIGSVALSCIYIETLEEGSGLSISTQNINWCSSEMYVNALTTAGITDAKVIVSAPFPVSGTAALTGAYKAYEDITGSPLDELAKSLGMEELVITGELADYIGTDEAAQIVNELKKILAQTKNMSDDEVRAEIRRIAKEYNTEITDEQVEQLLSLARKLEKMDIDKLYANLQGIQNTIKSVEKAGSFFSNIANGVKGFFTSVGDFFSNLFKKK